MNFYFVIGEPVRMQFSVAGAAPVPPTPPLPPSITSDYSLGYDWFVTNYDSGDNNVVSKSVFVPASTRSGALLVCCMSTYNASISGTGWTKIAESNPLSSGSTRRVTTIWAKARNGSRDSETITIDQGTKGLIGVEVFDFYGDEVDFDVVQEDVISSMPYIPPANTGKRRLYITASVYASAPPTIRQTLGFAKTFFDGRFAVYVDYMTGQNDVPTFGYDSNSYTAGSANCITLDVTISGV